MSQRGAAMCVIALSTVPSVAWGLVPQPGTQPGELKVPLKTPTYCAECHDFAEEQAPYRGWSGSMMGNATRDPLLWAALAVAEQDVPEVGDMCLRCHAPAGWLAGRVTSGTAPPTRGQALLPDDFEGVTCHFCHRMVPGPDGALDTSNGRIYVANDDIRRGPNEYPTVAWAPPHKTAQSEIFLSSELCGQCHNVTNPLVARREPETGEVLDATFPIERTFAEWKQSAYADPVDGKTCQDCHLPKTRDVKACDRKAKKHDVARHEFSGGNAWIPLVLAAEHPELGREEAYRGAHERAVSMLQEKSALLSAGIVGEARAGEGARILVRVENLTGHKLPTGYGEGRRMWLSVEARAGEETVFVSGAYDAETAELAMDPQAKVYEMVQGIWGIGPAFHFVRNDMILKDNRIPPRGFVPTPDTRPVGASYPELDGGALAHWDDTEYAFDLPADAKGALSVTVSLHYQTSSRDYVEFLRKENRTDDAGETLYSLWERHGMSPPVLMASVSIDAPIEPPIEPPMEPPRPPEVVEPDAGDGWTDAEDERGCELGQAAPIGSVRGGAGPWLLALGVALGRRAWGRRGKTREKRRRR